MTSNITKSFNQRKKFGLRMATGGILSTKQDDSTLFSAPGPDPSSKLALSLVAQAQPQDAVAANSSLSNTDRFKIANPTGDAYGVDGKMKGVVSVAPGSSAENSIFNEQGSLRQNMTDASNMSRLRRVDSMTGGNGLDMYRNSLSSGRGAGARFGLGLRAGGVVMPVEGEGTGTSDDVPVVLAGHEVNVSNGEGVAVLPAKTMRDKTAVDNIEKIIENSNGKPVNKGLRDGGAYEEGVVQKKEWRGWLEPKPTADFDPQTHKGVVPIVPGYNAPNEPAPVVQSKGTPAVMTDSSDYGREGRIASAQRAVSLDQAKSGFDVPTDARVVTRDGTRMYVGQQKQDATELRPANGTGYITGAPDAKGLRKTIFLGGDQEKYTDVDGKPTTDWTKTQRYKDQIEINSRMAKLADTMERDRLGRDAFSPEIKDPRVRAAALAQLSRLDSRDDQRDVVGLRQQIIDTQKGVLDLSNRKLDEVIRHNKFTEGATATRAKEARAEQAVKNLDALIADQGLSEADANAFRDFMRANYFGRKHMVKGKEVDVPGMEDMSSDQMRALMPDAVMRYKWNRDFNEASRTGTSQHEAKGLRNRKINWSDVSKGPTGLPDLFSTDSKGKIPVFGEGSWFESVTPDIFRNINDNVIEEVDANGNPIRVALARDINSDKTGSIDRSLYLKERGLK